MGKNRLTEDILASVYKYYNDKSNYLTESINEDGYCITVDDNMYQDLLSMVKDGVFQEMEDGQYLIPTVGNMTFHITPDGECYMDDDRGNEQEAYLDDDKAQTLLSMMKAGNVNTETDYAQVMEGKNNKFTHVEQDPKTHFIVFTKKDNVTPEEAMDAAHTAIDKVKQRREQEREYQRDEEEYNNRYDDLEYRDKARDYWNKRRAERAEPHGFSTSGTLPLFNMDDLNEESEADMTQNPNFRRGIMNESRIDALIDSAIKKLLK